MKYYIVKIDNEVTGKGYINTDNSIELGENKELVTKEVYDSIAFPEPETETLPQQPSLEERVSATEEAINLLLGL